MLLLIFCLFFFFKQKTAYEMRISDWSSDVCSSDLARPFGAELRDRRLQLVAHCVLDAHVDREPQLLAPARAVLEVLVKELLDARDAVAVDVGEIGRASCRERVCQYV